jgi:hypothetical protein
MNFEWYNPKTGAPVVSLANYGLTFSSGAVEVMGEPKFILLGFDDEGKILGVKPCEEFISKKRHGYVRISSRDFIRFLESRMPDGFKIEDKAAKYFTKWDKEARILKIFLEQPME